MRNQIALCDITYLRLIYLQTERRSSMDISNSYPDSKFVYANGIRHHYLTWGEYSLTPIILLHGIGLSCSVWNWTAKRLSERHNVLCFDMRGHGDGEKPPSGYTFPDLAKDLSEIIKALGLTQPLIVGHSAGGSAAIIAHAFEPGLLGPSLIIDSRVGGSRELSSRPEMQDRPSRTRRKRLIWESREAMREAYRARSVFQSWDEEIFNDYINGATRILPDGRSELKCPPEIEATLYEERTSLNTSPYLSNMKADILLFLGNYPGAQTLGDAGIQEFLDKVEGSQVKVSPMGSHFLPMEYPELLLAEIKQFISNHLLPNSCHF